MAQIEYSGKTDVGLKRKNNEDSLIINPDLGFCLVADGMGGAAAGEVASRIFAQTSESTFADFKGKSEKEAIEKVQKSFYLSNQKVFEHVKENPLHNGMGCTAELLSFFDEGFVLGHIGDSRTYRFRSGKLEQLTTDHSFVQDQIDQGLITPAEARKHHLRNLILRAVGVKENISIDLLRGKVSIEDQFLLCSDGLTDMVEDRHIEKILARNDALASKNEQLIEMAMSSGGKDNITVVLARIKP
ncbi:MAG: Stp1/IreP family PP2C-type Ser/Thr phosphatase [Deltaproteobacteria bacterium]|nr:Stp1/IreP family PP2C-type Ser/Thr phosphatase [Deltaproteobacteria bacterium]